MTDTASPTVLVFDVNETLLDIETLAPLFARVFGDAAVLRDWFAQTILHAEAATLAGHYLPFGRLAGGVLRMLGTVRGVPVDEADVEELRTRTLAMPPHPDVVPALRRLAAAGFRLVTLTNSAPDPAVNPLERAGVAPLLERQFTVDAVRRFKPAPEVYRQVSDALGLPGPDFCLVAAHHWDTVGAQTLGWAGALVTRPGNAAVPALPQPDVTAPDLEALAEAMIGRWRR